MTPVRPIGPRNIQKQQPTNSEGQTDVQQEQNVQQENINLLGFDDFMDPKARLGKPKTLLELWHEYLHGLHGRKPAKDFTPRERGRSKFTYSRRRNFWEIMVKLIRAGYNELTAIDLIEQCYGRGKPITYICVALCKAKRMGYHPNLAFVVGL